MQNEKYLELDALAAPENTTAIRTRLGWTQWCFSYFLCVFSTFTPCLAQSILDVKLENAYNQTAKREKSRKRTMQSGLFLLGLLGVFVVFLLFLRRRLVSILHVWTGLIIKFDIFCDRCSELLLGAVFCSVKFFSFH